MNNRLFDYKTTVCPVCNPVDSGISNEEKDLLESVRKIYNGIILENDRTVLSPYELDIYLPELKIGIEFNGEYWHSRPDVKRNDMIKRAKCRENSIKCITVKESDWLTDKARVITRIRNILNEYERKQAGI